MNNRANTDQEKEEVVRRVLNAWKSCPDLRLGQFLINATSASTELFYQEDYDLALACEDYVEWLFEGQENREK